jgi:hypothetical protein
MAGRGTEQHEPGAIVTLASARSDVIFRGAGFARLRAQCPACGAAVPQDAPCQGCGHRQDLSRWTQGRRARVRALTALWDTPSGPYASVGAVTVLIGLLAAAVFRTGFDATGGFACVVAFSAAFAAPMLFVGARAITRQWVRREWVYDGPDGVLCVAKGTVFELESAVRMRPIAIGECTVSDELAGLAPGQARALLEVPEVLARLSFGPAPRLAGASRERAECCIAAAIALARLVHAGRVRLVRTALVRSYWSDVSTVQRSDDTVVFGLHARGASPGDGALERWWFRALPSDEREVSGGGYRAAARVITVPSPGALSDLGAVFQRAIGEAKDPVALVRGLVNEDGGWRDAAPSLSTESRAWLAECVAVLWESLATPLGARNFTR